MTGRCATCRHWKHPLDGYNTLVRLDYRDDYDEEERLRVAYEQQYGECQAAEFLPQESDYPTPESAPPMIVQDGSGYRADLYTRAEFGCTLWEPLNGGSEGQSASPTV